MTQLRARLFVALACSLVCVFVTGATLALAHAQYAASTPPANATISAAPATVHIGFTQEVSDIQIAVTGPNGSSVVTGPATFDLAQRHNTSVPIRDAGPGQYTIVWHNVSGDDGDSNDGSFVFTVADPAAVSSGPGTGSAAAAATPRAPTTCRDTGRTPGINDVRVDTYCKRQAIRDKYVGQIDVASFNDDLAAGKGLESALADARADFQAAQTKKH